MTKKYTLKLKAGNYKIPVFVTEDKNRLYLQFPFNRDLLTEVKCMKGARWHGYDDVNPRKIWSIPDCERNRFQLAFLAGQNPYARYEAALKSVKANRDSLYSHQVYGKSFVLSRRQCFLAYEMGAGKTLIAIEVIEDSGYTDWLWVGPRSALAAVELEFDIWEAKIIPKFVTYERVRQWVKNNNIYIPEGIVGDESSKIKTPTAQRSEAFLILTDEMRKCNPDCFIILMSGAPAPKAPTDWWNQCEVACPGFIREGDIHKFRNRMAIIREEESITGGVYPKLVTWLDDEKKCNICGKVAKEHFTDELSPEDHPWQASRNEVAYLYKRMEGLVDVKFKEDCLDLPDKLYKKIVIEPSPAILRALDLILASEIRTVTALMKARELSDGFQYKEEATGRKVTCELCKGSKQYREWYDPEYPDEVPSPNAMESSRCQERICECENCNGTGEVPEYKRTVKEVPCAKEKVFIDLLDEHEGIGRLVTYAGFQASVDRLVNVSLKYGWDVLRVDGRGWLYCNQNGPASLDNKEMLRRFQYGDEEKIVFIGQPGAAGMGLNLTASPTCFFYSNSFNADDRIQAVERIHRPGMDRNRGATIIDVVHLYTDQYILDNLEKKVNLLQLTMGKFKEGMQEYANK